jgi:asparagine synthase (glutamine-hydrolysing)
MSDVPIGVLSGGLDSSLTCNCSEIIGGAREKLHSFSIGLDADAPDAAARKVLLFLATEHHEIYFQ